MNAVLDIRCAQHPPGATLMRSIAVAVAVCSFLVHLSKQDAANGTSSQIALTQPPTLVVSTARPIVPFAEEHGIHFNHRSICLLSCIPTVLLIDAVSTRPKGKCLPTPVYAPKLFLIVKLLSKCCIARTDCVLCQWNKVGRKII